MTIILTKINSDNQLGSPSIFFNQDDFDYFISAQPPYWKEKIKQAVKSSGKGQATRYFMIRDSEGKAIGSITWVY